MPQEEQKLRIFMEHMSSSPVFVAQSLVFYVLLCRSLLVFSCEILSLVARLSSVVVNLYKNRL
jgi:hypothetical protein